MGMMLKYTCRVVGFSYLIQAVIALTMVDDTAAGIVYSDSGPSWWGATAWNGRGKYVGGALSADDFAYDITWHETVGDGVWFTYTFNGTRVSLVSTVPNNGYNSTLNFYIDDEFKSQYQHLVPGPMAVKSINTPTVNDIQLKVTIADFPDLPAAQHTFKGVSVGSDSLFVVDAIFYEPANVTTTASSTSASTTGSTSTTSSTTTTTTTNSTSTSTSSTTTQPTLTAPTVLPGDSQSVTALMDVKPSDSRIVYSPPGTWKQYSNARRATSCLEGTMISSTAGSSLTYNFTGSSVQLYTVSAPDGGNYSMSIDGVNQGSYSSYDGSADPSSCGSKALFSTTTLANTEHTLVLTVEDHASGSTQDTIQFVGFRTSSSTANVNSPTSGSSSSSSSLNLGAIIGGAVGGIAGLTLFVFLVVWWMRRQRRLSEESHIAQFPDPSLHSAFTGDPLISGARSRTESYSHSHAQWVAEPSTPPFMIPENPQDQQALYHEYTAAPPTHTDDDSDLDRLTHYTLPSHRERVRDRPAARDLSDADVDAISRRLQEVMRSQMVQAGGDPNEFGGMMPPRELIDSLVEEQLQPRSV